MQEVGACPLQKRRGEWTGQIPDDEGAAFRVQKKFTVINLKGPHQRAWGLFSTCVGAVAGAGAGVSRAVVLCREHREVDGGKWRVLPQCGSNP